MNVSALRNSGKVSTTFVDVLLLLMLLGCRDREDSSDRCRQQRWYNTKPLNMRVSVLLERTADERRRRRGCGHTVGLLRLPSYLHAVLHSFIMRRLHRRHRRPPHPLLHLPHPPLRHLQKKKWTIVRSLLCSYSLYSYG